MVDSKLNPFVNLDNLAEYIHMQNVSKGFWKDENEVLTAMSAEDAPKVAKAFKLQRVALVHSELSESVEALRKDAVDDHLPQYPGFAVELVDSLIRIFDMCGAYNIPVSKIMEDKLAYNSNRPYKHGKEF